MTTMKLTSRNPLTLLTLTSLVGLGLTGSGCVVTTGDGDTDGESESDGDSDSGDGDSDSGDSEGDSDSGESEGDSEGGELPPCEDRVELTNAEFIGGLVLEAGTCWMVSENLSLDDGIVRVEEGVSVQFATDIGVTIKTGGQLNVAGTEANPVRFETGDPLVTWKGVRFEDSQGSDNTWQHTIVANAGSDQWTGAEYTAGALFLEGSSTLQMDGVIIRSSQAHGLLAQGDVVFTFTNGAFEENETPAYVHPEVAGSIGAETSFEGNTNAFVRVVFGNNDTVVGSQAWSALAVPYRVADRFFVDGDLTLDPGVVVEMEQEVSVIVEPGASLTAEGTEAEPIVIRGASAGTRGFWKGIELRAGGTDDPLTYGATFDHVELADAGGAAWTGRADTFAALYMGDASAALITNSTITNSDLYGLWASGNARIDGFSGNTFTANGRPMYLHPDRVGELSGTSEISGNDEDRIFVVMGNNDVVSVDATWKDLGVPYDMTDRSFVEAAIEIDPGVTLEFGQDVQWVVREAGSLTANGTSEQQVTLAGANAVDTGYWSGVRFESNSPANALAFTTISHTGSAMWTGDAESYAAIYLDDGASVDLNTVDLGPGTGYGVFVAASESMLSCTDVTFSSLTSGNVWDDDADGALPGC